MIKAQDFIDNLVTRVERERVIEQNIDRILERFGDAKENVEYTDEIVYDPSYRYNDETSPTIVQRRITVRIHKSRLGSSNPKHVDIQRVLVRYITNGWGASIEGDYVTLKASK